MKHSKILLSAMMVFALLTAHAQNPWKKYGYTPPKALTLSDGKYEEFFNNDTVTQIGSVMFNTVTNEVVAFVDIKQEDDETRLRPEVISRFLSVDPLEKQFPFYTPYQFAGNTPIQASDLDGLEPNFTAKDAYFGDITVLAKTEATQIVVNIPTATFNPNEPNPSKQNKTGKTTTTTTNGFDNSTKIEPQRSTTPAKQSVVSKVIEQERPKPLQGEALEYVPIEMMLLPASTPLKTGSKILDIAVDIANPVSGVRHYTNQAGMEAIQKSGILQKNTFITTPGDIPTGSTANQVENILEIKPGRGEYFIDIPNPGESNLKVPANGPSTSGGAFQRQTTTDTPVNPSDFKRTEPK